MKVPVPPPSRSPSAANPVPEIPVEMLPGRGRRGRPGAQVGPGEGGGDAMSSFLQRLSFVLDDWFRVPGTKHRFGLDPLLGFIPVVGDTATAVISSVFLLAAVRYRMPLVTVLRMMFNIFLNSVVTSVPVLGNIFTFWFKSNNMNYQLLRRHVLAAAAAPGAGGQARAQLAARDTTVLVVVGVVFLVLVAGCTALGFYLSLEACRAVWDLFTAAGGGQGHTGAF